MFTYGSKHPTGINMATLKGIQVRAKKPPGYISTTVFGKRMGITPSTVSRAVREGRVKQEDCVFLQNGGRYVLHVCWETVYPTFIKRWARTKWPLWFTDPYNNPMPGGTDAQQTVLKRMCDDRAQSALDADRHNAPTGDTKTGGKKALADVGEAVLEEKRLKVEKMQMEMDREKNLSIDIDVAKAVMTEAAQATRQGFTSLIPRLAPLFTAETSQHKITTILQDEFDKVLGQLATAENFGSE